MDNDITTKTEEGEIILYQPDDTISLEVHIDTNAETVWLTQQQMVQLFGSSKANISEHISNIYQQGELEQEATVRIFRTVRKEGNRKVTRKIEYYNLDMIISVGYRVNTNRGILFRQWATKVLREYLLRGYAIQPQLQKVEYHLSREISEQNDRIHSLEMKIHDQQQQVDFLVNIHNQPKEELFGTGCMWDAYSYIANIIRTAKKEVILVDNYCNDKTLTLLGYRAEGVKATIHTTYNKSFEDALEAYNSQNPEIEFIQLPHKIHDRFLIIDQQVYLLGTSLKDMGHTLSAAILTGFTPEEILSKLV